MRLRVGVPYLCGDGKPVKLRQEGDAGVADEPICECGSKSCAGHGRRIENRDTYAADASCLRCGKPVGIIRVRVNTLFGIEEDERVARMGVRIY